MQVTSVGLIWISVRDFEKALSFYTETLGLKLLEKHEEFGWAELEGHDGGTRFAIAKCQGGEGEILPGQNGVATFSVDSIEVAVDDLKKKGVRLIGAIQEVPGHVKLQMVQDGDGNHIQLVELLG